MVEARLEKEPEEEYKVYSPERNYRVRDYKAFKKPFADLCGHCTKYYKNINFKGLTTKTFPPVCRGHITDDLMFLKQEDFETEAEFFDVAVLSDPVTWAFTKFGWEARWYQQEMQSCTANKKVVRAGRRIGKSENIVMHMLWLAQTNDYFSILVIAPFQSQVTLLFDALNKFISLDREISGSVRRNTKNPSRIEFNNGSKILGFSSGAQSAAKSDKIRGQDANYIVLDEADYLGEADLEAILAILASHPHCGLWASSTPTGKHGKFYQWCVQKNLGFKEFHYVSAESPSWTKETEEFFRDDYDIVQYEHEFLAEFGVQTKGVFRNDLIDKSIENYKMPFARGNGSQIVVGVDWNGADIGVHMVIVEWHGGKYRLLDKRIVKSKELTQSKAIEEIIDINNMYNPDFIYVDKGYGEVQVEMLHKYGMKHPDSGLRKKVKAYSFGEQIEIVEPITQRLAKKPSKPFAVNSVVAQLEEDRLILPMAEDTQVLTETVKDRETSKSKGLVQQMRNYEVLRYSTLGLPTYSQGEDHTLVAYMLAITGFLLEFSDLRTRKFVSRVISVGDPTNREKEQEKDKGINNAYSNIVRQLDSGSPIYGYSRGNAGSILRSSRDKDKLRKKINDGDRNAFKKHFNKRHIDRTSRLDRGPDAGKRGTF